MEVLLSRVIFKSQLSEPHELGRTGGAAAFHRSWHERHPGPVEHAARLRCLLLGAHPSHPTGDRPPSCGGALPRRECGHAQRVVPGGLVRRGAAVPRRVGSGQKRGQRCVGQFGNRRSGPTPTRACSASANSTRPSTLSARCRAWTSSRWATNGAGVHHHIEFSGVLDRRLDRSVARMGITPTTGCPGPRAPNDPPWGPQASLNSRALVLPWRRTLSGCEYLAAWP